MIGRSNIYKPFKDQYRTKLYHEDVKFSFKDLMEYGLCARLEIEGEGVYAMTKGFAHPDFNMFFRSKVTSTKDPYFRELILRLLYLNPGITQVGRIKLATYAIRVWVEIKKVDGEWVSAVSNEEFVGALVHLEKEASMYMPNSTKVVLFSKDTKLTSEQRAICSLKTRAMIIRHLMDMSASHVLEYIGEKKSLQRITHKRIAEVSHEIERGISEYMSKKSESPIRKKRMAELNRHRPLKTTKALEKYNQYIALNKEGLTTQAIAKALGISKSTLIEYKGIKDGD